MRSPAGREVFDAIWTPGVEQVTLLCGTQLMKTMLLFLSILYNIDKHGVPCLFVMKTYNKACDVSQRRLQPLIEEQDFVQRRMLAGKGAWKIAQMMFTSCTLTVYGAGSTSQLSSDACGLALLDEIDDWDEGAEDGKEGGMYGQAESRLKSYGMYAKKVIATSPTIEDRIGYREYLTGTMSEWEVPCIHCGGYQTLEFQHKDGKGGFRWPKEMRNPGQVYENTWYECRLCGGQIEDHHRWDMQQNGRWRDQRENKRHKSYRLSSLNVLPDVYSFGHFAERFLKCYPIDSQGNAITTASPYPDRLHVVVNHDWCQVWQARQGTVSEDEILKHRDVYEPSVSPIWPTAIIITADVGEHESWYSVCAWDSNETVYLIDYGMVGNMEDLSSVGQRYYVGPDGETKWQPTHAYADVGYDPKDPNATRVIDFCRRHGWMGVKGHSQSQQVRIGEMDGEQILLVNGDHFKGKFWGRMRIKLGDPGSIHFHRETESLVANHMRGEYLGRKKMADGSYKQTWIRTGPNHYFDTWVYQFAAAQHARVRSLPILGPPRKPTYKPKVREEGLGPGSW